MQRGCHAIIPTNCYASFAEGGAGGEGELSQHRQAWVGRALRGSRAMLGQREERWRELRGNAAQPSVENREGTRPLPNEEAFSASTGTAPQKCLYRGWRMALGLPRGCDHSHFPLPVLMVPPSHQT